MATIDLGERLVTKKERVLSNNGNEERYSSKQGITANSATDKTVPTTKAVKEYVDNNIYTHPSYTAITGQPTSDKTPSFGGTFTVSQIKSDITGHINGATDRTITIPSTTATTSANGLMSKEDKTKLDGIATGANKYTHPSYTARTGEPTENQSPGFGESATFSQIEVDSLGHVTKMTDRTLTIPSLAWKTRPLQVRSVTWLNNASEFNNAPIIDNTDEKADAHIFYNQYIVILELNIGKVTMNLPANDWLEFGQLPAVTTTFTDNLKPYREVGTINTYGNQKRSYIKVTPNGYVYIWSDQQITKAGITGTLMWRRQ